MKLIVDTKNGGVVPIIPDAVLNEWGEDFRMNNPYGCKTFLAHILISMNETQMAIKRHGALTIPEEYVIK